MSKPLSTRLSQVLLLIGAVSNTVATASLLFLVFNYSRIRSLQSKLLEQNELQELLLKGTATDYCLTPHASGNIGGFSQSLHETR